MATPEPLTRGKRLEAARDALAALIPDATPAQLPALVKEYRATLAELAEIEASAPVDKPRTPLDELAKRRASSA